MSSLIPLSVDTIAVGLVSSVVVYPIYLVILFLFRMSRSKVGWDREASEPHCAVQYGSWRRKIRKISQLD